MQLSPVLIFASFEAFSPYFFLSLFLFFSFFFFFLQSTIKIVPAKRLFAKILPPRSPVVEGFNCDQRQSCLIVKRLRFITIGRNKRLLWDVPPGHISTLLTTSWIMSVVSSKCDQFVFFAYWMIGCDCKRWWRMVYVLQPTFWWDTLKIFTVGCLFAQVSSELPVEAYKRFIFITVPVFHIF